MLAICAALVAALGPQAEDHQASVLRVHDLAGLLVEFDEGLDRLAAAPPISHVEMASFGRRPDGQPVAPAAVLDAAFQLFEPELGYEDRLLQLATDDRLVALMPEPLQAELAGLVGFLGDALGRTHALRLRRYVLGSSAQVVPTGALDAEAFAALLGALGAPVDDLALALRSGATGVLDLREARPFLVDYDVEVANGSAAFDPQTVDALLGWSLAARAVPAEGGAFVALAAQHSEAPRPLRTVATTFASVVTVSAAPDRDAGENPFAPVRPVRVEAPEQRPLESLELLQRGLLCEAFVPHGGGLAVRLRAELPLGTVDELWAIEVAGPAESVLEYRSELTGRRLVLVDPGAAARPSLAFDPGSPLRATAYVLDWWSARIAAAQPGFLLELLPGRARNWARLGHLAFQVTDDAGLADRARATLGALSGAGATAAVSVAGETRTGERAALELPLTVGGRCAAWVAQFQWLVSDADVEVANSCSVRDPRVAPVAEGFFAAVSGQPAAEGWDVDVRAELRHRARGPRGVVLGDRLGGAFELLDLAGASVAAPVRLVPGEGASLAGGGTVQARLVGPR